MNFEMDQTRKSRKLEERVKDEDLEDKKRTGKEKDKMGKRL